MFLCVPGCTPKRPNPVAVMFSEGHRCPVYLYTERKVPSAEGRFLYGRKLLNKFISKMIL